MQLVSGRHTLSNGIPDQILNPDLPSMRFVQKYLSLGLIVLFFAVSSALVIRQFTVNRTRHAELREAFVLLHSKGYRPEAERLFERLVDQVEDLSDTLLWEDYQRTLTLVDPTRDQPDNLVWQYHWTVSNQLEKRSQSSLSKALRLAKER